MDNIIGSNPVGDDGNALGISDLMTVLMIVFLFIAIAFIKTYHEQAKEIKEIATEWQKNEAAIYNDLFNEFQHDLEKWGAEIERETLIFRFKEPEIFFKQGDVNINHLFSTILSNFFPRYIDILRRYNDSIEEIRIEGHTSSEWNTETESEEAYFLNMELSHGRTVSVLRFILSLDKISPDRKWAANLITANGLSSSRLIHNDDGRENKSLSRRVEFRIRTKTRKEIIRILDK